MRQLALLTGLLFLLSTFSAGITESLAPVTYKTPRVSISVAETNLSEAKISGVGAASRNRSPEAIEASAAFSSYEGFILDKYLSEIDSPLAGHGQDFMRACEKYDTPNCTLLPAIAQIETNYCKTEGSFQQKNCWGWGGSGENRILFDSFPEAIDTITRELMENYGSRFFENGRNGGTTYCGSHCTEYGDHIESAKTLIRKYYSDHGIK